MTKDTTKEQQRSDLVGQISGVQGQLDELGDAPKASIELNNLLQKKSRADELRASSLKLADTLGKSAAYGRQAADIRRKVEQGFFVSGTSSSSRQGRSTFSVSFSRQTQGLDDLLARQKKVDQDLFSARKGILQSQLVTAQSALDLFDQSNRSAKDRLSRETAARSKLRKKRGRASLRTKGSRSDIIEDTQTTTDLLG